MSNPSKTIKSAAAKTERVDKLLRLDMSVTQACKTVGIKTATYYRVKRAQAAAALVSEARVDSPTLEVP